MTAHMRRPSNARWRKGRQEGRWFVDTISPGLLVRSSNHHRIGYAIFAIESNILIEISFSLLSSLRSFVGDLLCVAAAELERRADRRTDWQRTAGGGQRRSGGGPVADRSTDRRRSGGGTGGKSCRRASG